MFYFFKRGSETIQCEVRSEADGPGFEIVITESDGAERWMELHKLFEHEGWWGPATQDGRG